MAIGATEKKLPAPRPNWDYGYLCRRCHSALVGKYVVRLDPDDEKGCGIGRTAPAAWRDAYYSKEFLDRKDASKQ